MFKAHQVGRFFKELATKKKKRSHPHICSHLSNTQKDRASESSHRASLPLSQARLGVVLGKKRTFPISTLIRNCSLSGDFCIGFCYCHTRSAPAAWGRAARITCSTAEMHVPFIFHFIVKQGLGKLPGWPWTCVPPDSASKLMGLQARTPFQTRFFLLPLLLFEAESH